MPGFVLLDGVMCCALPACDAFPNIFCIPPPPPPSSTSLRRAQGDMVQLDLDMPARTTRVYESPSAAASAVTTPGTVVQRALQDAFATEEDAWFSPASVTRAGEDGNAALSGPRAPDEYTRRARIPTRVRDAAWKWVGRSETT